MISTIFDIHDILIKKDLPYALYRLPGEKEFSLIFQKNNEIQNIEIINIEKHTGFVIASFDSAKTGTARLIAPDFILNNNSDLTEAKNFLTSLPDSNNHTFNDNFIASKSSYLNTATYLINKLVDGELQKVVLSRVIHKQLHNKLNLSSLLMMVAQKYDHAFINLVHLPNEGTWFGASPELLFKIVDDNVYTDALAGTKLIIDDNEPKWTFKEKEEQYLVTQFIESLLSELGITNFEKIGPITKTAGNVAHLQTKFKIPLSSLIDKKGKLIAGLHPTPAVCGLPKADSYLLIQRAEQHERRYYTGFLGPWNITASESENPESMLFVNLRCAEICKDKVNIYVGGGLTSSSDPEDEFQETVHKSNTLLSIVENL